MSSISGEGQFKGQEPDYNGDGRIHVLGVGNLARLISFALATSSSPPLTTLLFHRPTLQEDWIKAGSKLSLTTKGDISSTNNILISSPSDQSPIKNLIATTKNFHTISAIRALKHRLDSTSTILFTQNGLGIIEEVSSAIFPDPESRPVYVASITTHGVYSLAPFHSVHAGLGTMSIGPVSSSSKNTQSHYLRDKIINAPLLNATSVSSSDLLIFQLLKLTINALINPLTVLYHGKNGLLIDASFPHFAFIKRLQSVMLAEISAVILALPEMRGYGEEQRAMFSVKRLRDKVQEINEAVSENRSSMYQDVEAGRETEIRWMNGWVVRRGREVGVECKVNDRVVELVSRGFPKEGCDVERDFDGLVAT